MTSPFGFPPFDPSKMDPKTLMELSQLIQQLPREQLDKMQTIMHNMMAGYDVRREMEEFEKTLPPGFREKLVTMMGNANMQIPTAATTTSTSTTGATAEVTTAELGLRDARLTVLRAVARGEMSPEEAEHVLFTENP